MQVTVIGRHIEATEALKQYATEKFSRLDKYLPKTIQVVVTLSVVKKVHHIAEAVIKSNGLLIQASEETEEMYSAIDLLIEKIERRVRRYKEKLVDHKHQTGKTEALAVTPRTPRTASRRSSRPSGSISSPCTPKRPSCRWSCWTRNSSSSANAGSGHVNVIYKTERRQCGTHRAAPLKDDRRCPRFETCCRTT